MAEPKDIVDFDSLTPASTDYLILQRSASVGGKATVAAAVEASGLVPYQLHFDATTRAGTESETAVTTVVVPAGALATDGSELVIDAVVSTSSTGGFGIFNLGIPNSESVVPFGGSMSSGVRYPVVIRIMRTSATEALIIYTLWDGGSENRLASFSHSITWASAVALTFNVTSPGSLLVSRVMVHP